MFADPKCGYCKVFERTLQELTDVTVYTFLLPILGTDSRGEGRDIWCAKDSWMLGLDGCSRIVCRIRLTDRATRLRSSATWHLLKAGPMAHQAWCLKMARARPGLCP
ncbi:MAG: thioredoxin fold domain-containing protein [Inhella sp.]